MSAPATDLFAHVDQEDWLANRLKALKADLGGAFPTLKDRLKHVIETQGYEWIIAGRNAEGKPETFAQAWGRVYRDALHVKPNRRGKR